jgi:hypothetical protein
VVRIGLMNERAEQVLHTIYLYDRIAIDNELLKHGWEGLQSLLQVGIDPDTTIISLFDDNGKNGAKYEKHIKEIGLSDRARQEVWRTLTLFLNDIEGAWPDDSEPTIGDFAGLKAKQLKGFTRYSEIQARILERLFAPPQK